MNETMRTDCIKNKYVCQSTIQYLKCLKLSEDSYNIVLEHAWNSRMNLPQSVRDVQRCCRVTNFMKSNLMFVRASLLSSSLRVREEGDDCETGRADRTQRRR